MNKLINNILHILIVVVLIINNITIIKVSAVDDTSIDRKQEKVVVGYVKNYAVIHEPQLDYYMGYGYEFLDKINKYTETEYIWEFVEVPLIDRVGMLINNEIDLMIPTSKTLEQQDLILFSRNKFADENIILNSKNTYYIDEDNYDWLNDKTIAFRQKSGSAEYLYAFLEEHQLTPTLIEAETSVVDEVSGELSYDFLLSRTLQMQPNTSVALTLAHNETFFAANLENEKLIMDIDNAIDKIKAKEYMYLEELYLKYFEYNTEKNKFITQEEFDLVQSQEIYDVGVVNLYRTFGFDSTNSITNMSLDIAYHISKTLGVNVNVVEISPFESKENTDKLDFMIHLTGYSPEYYEKVSIPYMEENLLLFKAPIIQGTQKLGVLEYFDLEDQFITNLTELTDITHYMNLEDMLADFESGEINTILLGDALYNILFGMIGTLPHTIESLNYPIMPKIIFTNEFADEKIKVFNKAISYITNDDIEFMTYANVAKMTYAQKMETFFSYMVALTFVILFVLIIIMSMRYSKKKEVEQAKNFDRVTNLYTHVKFSKETKKLITKNPNSKYAMFSFDIDNFKYINELYGFDIGDLILEEIGKFIIRKLTFKYPVARISGDYFIVIVEDRGYEVNNEKLINTLNSLRQQFDKYIGKSYVLDISVGCYLINDISINVEQMIDYCNLARSYSKDELGTMVTVYSDLMKKEESIKNDIISRMNNALKEREFVLYYQPKFDLITQNIVGAEALVRWFSDGKMMPPNDFIPLFEKNGFIEKLDYYVLDTACRFISDNKNKKIPVISVNISSVTIMKNDVVQKIIDIVNSYSIDPKRIELEVTESAFVDQFEVALQRINDLRAKGFGISMDDFGTGVSSLGRLKDMELDVLKIDREFVIEILNNDKADVILESVISMAHKLNLETIAEGIETEEQLTFLRNNGCDLGQGYYFARPLPSDEFLQMLK